MKDRHVFVDTNILVYAHDHSAGEKGQRAKQVVADLWNRPYPPAISVQVLQEFFVNLIRKKVSFDEARKATENYFAWEVIVNECGLMTAAFEVQERYATSFWDALIIAAANRARAATLFSEDLNHNQVYGTVKVVNPLLP